MVLIKGVVWLPGFEPATIPTRPDADTLMTEPRSRQVYPATYFLSVITGRCPGQVQGSSVRLYIPPYFRSVVGLCGAGGGSVNECGRPTQWVQKNAKNTRDALHRMWS